METKKHIEVEFKTKRKFDKLQADLKFKGIRKNKSELIELLINNYKQSKNIIKNLGEKVQALTSELEKRELEIEELRK